MVSTLPICPVSPRPLECLSPLVKSLDHWYQQQKPLEPGLGSAFAVFSVHFGPVFISPTSQWCKPHKPSESGHHLALVLLLAGRPLFPCIARFTVIYTPDRWPKCPWISRGTAPAVPSSQTHTAPCLHQASIHCLSSWVHTRQSSGLTQSRGPVTSAEDKMCAQLCDSPWLQVG